jgi:hypothetical protein
MGLVATDDELPPPSAPTSRNQRGFDRHRYQASCRTSSVRSASAPPVRAAPARGNQIQKLGTEIGRSTVTRSKSADFDTLTGTLSPVEYFFAGPADVEKT